jgi:hypothetical protein
MTVDFIVSSLPPLTFGAPAPLTREQFEARAGVVTLPAKWTDLDTQLRNALAEARGGESFCRPARGCSLFWKKRVFDAYAEKDIARREDLLDRVWWEAAGELTDVASPLGAGALQTYAVRLVIALKRARISSDAGNAAFDRLTAETRIEFPHG